MDAAKIAELRSVSVEWSSITCLPARLEVTTRFPIYVADVPHVIELRQRLTLDTSGQPIASVIEQPALSDSAAKSNPEASTP